MEEAGDARQRAVIRVLREEASVWLMEEAIDVRQRAVIGMLKQEVTA